ncbi:MAG: hypothetical protein EOM83_05345 [Clostridia bacterium]|nr:hypothetical protein [Clostridia bacterium]
MTTNRLLQIGLLVLMMAFMAGCEYEFIKPAPTPPPPDPTDTIKFAQQVVPIWDANSCTNCHKPGGTPQLDLTAANAFSSLTSLAMYNVDNPPASRIYNFPYPETGDHSFKYATQAEAELILQWITQGAKNN